MNTDLLNFIPPHQTFVELLHGGAPILLAKQRSKVEFVSDPAGEIANFFRVLRSPSSTEQLRRVVAFGGQAADGSVDRAAVFSRSAQQIMGIRRHFSWMSLISERLQGVQIESRPFDDVVTRLDRHRTLFLVNHQIAGTLSQTLIDQLRTVRGKVIIRYRGPLPLELLPGDWRTIDCASPSTGSVRGADTLLLNFSEE